MARKKMSELDVLAARVVRMRQALELGLKCGCVRIEDCTLSPADVPPMKDQQIKATGVANVSTQDSRVFWSSRRLLKSWVAICHTLAAQNGSSWLLVPAGLSLMLFAGC